MSKLKSKKHFDIEKKVKELKNLTVSIGFPKENSKTNSQKKGVTALFKAVKNEFGLGVPKRPFLSIAFHKNKDDYKKMVLNALKKPDSLNYVDFLNKLGLKGQGDVQKSIVDLRSPPNAQSTIELKGSANPLIADGHMMGSTTYIVKDKK